MARPDAIEILVQHQVAALVRCGRPLDMARGEAENIVAVVLEDLARTVPNDVCIGVAIRRARVYRLRCQKHTYKVICERLGISRYTADLDYRAELARRRAG